MKQENGIVRVTIKLPKHVADYFRKTFKHGERSKFLERCILEYKHKKNIQDIEENLRGLRKKVK